MRKIVGLLGYIFISVRCESVPLLLGSVLGPIPKFNHHIERTMMFRPSMDISKAMHLSSI
jgi:TctA family transporter